MVGKFRRELASWPYRVFLGGLVVMLAHLLEDALVHKENGSSVGAQLGSSALTLLLVAIGVVVYPLLRRVRPVLVGFYGLLAFSGGWRAHVTDALDGDASGGDYSGVVYALAGIALIGLALYLAVALVRGRSVSPGRRQPDDIERE
jgi:hypothetical protein